MIIFKTLKSNLVSVFNIKFVIFFLRWFVLLYFPSACSCEGLAFPFNKHCDWLRSDRPLGGIQTSCFAASWILSLFPLTSVDPAVQKRTRSRAGTSYCLRRTRSRRRRTETWSRRGTQTKTVSCLSSRLSRFYPATMFRFHWHRGEFKTTLPRQSNEENWKPVEGF